VSRRKNISEMRGRVSAATATTREKQESKIFELGFPATPPYLWNNKPLYAIWKKYSKWLYERRLLAYSDGAALLELCEAELAGQAERKKTILHGTWKRPRFPEPVYAGSSLAAFIERVRQERDSFSDRLRPDQTLMLEENGMDYDWATDDATTIARQYARETLASPDAGVLMKLACERWLKDIEEGHLRGAYWDVVAARNVVTYAKKFGGLDNILPWEVWVLTSMFAFKRASGLRKHSEIWLSMGRKNGKTKFASIVAQFLLICDQEKYAEIYAASTVREQSRIVWRDARRAVGDNPELAAHVTRWVDELLVNDTDSKFQPLASEDRSFLGVRASGIIADEVGVWADRNAWDALVQSTVSRTQPLTLAITTAPAHKLTFAFEKFSWAERILRGIVLADHVFAAIFRIDDGDDPKDIVKLRKANPSLGVTLREEHIVKQISELEESPSGLNNFLQFHANITPERTLQRQGSISPKSWDKCSGFDLIGETDSKKAVTKFLQLNTDTPCYCGIDIGLRNDFTAVCLLFPKGRFSEGAEPIDRQVVVVQCFAPEVGLLEKERSWGVPLSVWARTDFLQLLPGDMIDLRDIKQYVVDLNTRFRVMECGFDPWQFPSQAAQLNESGITCVSVPQVYSQLTAPSQEFLSAVQRCSLVHFGAPLLAWMAGNVVFVESEKHSGLKPEKLSPNEKIDGIASIVTAWHRYLANPPRGVARMYFMGEDGEWSKADGKGGIEKMPPLPEQVHQKGATYNG